MYAFCPHCGQTTEEDQVAGRMLVCAQCGMHIGVVETERSVVVDETEELIRRGTAARCPICQQAVAVKAGAKTLVPHYQAAGVRKICPGSAKTVG